jgi:hypothetical protein
MEMKWKKRSSPDVRYCTWTSLKGLQKTTWKNSYNRRFPVRDLNSGPHEYKAGMLISRPLHINLRLKINLEIRTEKLTYIHVYIRKPNSTTVTNKRAYLRTHGGSRLRWSRDSPLCRTRKPWSSLQKGCLWTPYLSISVPFTPSYSILLETILILYYHLRLGNQSRHHPHSVYNIVCISQRPNSCYVFHPSSLLFGRRVQIMKLPRLRMLWLWLNVTYCFIDIKPVGYVNKHPAPWSF